MADEGQKNSYEIYEIKIQGQLDAKWSEWFYDMVIVHESDGTTSLRGSLPDQIVLHSVLDRIRDMNLPLISVNHIVSSGQMIDPEAKGTSQEKDPTGKVIENQKGETDHEN